MGHFILLKIIMKQHPSALLTFLLVFYNVFDIYECNVPALWIPIHLLGERENSTTGQWKGQDVEYIGVH